MKKLGVANEKVKVFFEKSRCVFLDFGCVTLWFLNDSGVQFLKFD